MNAIMAKSGSNALDEGAFYLVKLPIPEPGVEDLLVKVIAIGMNPVDTKIRMRPGEDSVLGWDVYGEVEKTGVKVTGFQKGDKIFYAGELTRPGCNSEYHLVHSKIASLAPVNLSPEESAAMPLTSITAWEGLFERLGFTAGQNANKGKSLLIIGGAGGVGSVAIQLAHWAGIHVYATASRPETIQWCKRLGADPILNHRNDLFEELKASGTDSVDAIFCTTQMEKHWKAMSECVRPQGRIVLIDDPKNPVDIRVFKIKSVAICWEFMYTRSMFQTEDLSEQGSLLQNVAKLLDRGTIVSTVHKTLKGLTPENFRNMHSQQESGTMMGKQVLIL